MESSRLRLEKQKAVDAENFIEAGRLKKQEAEVAKKLEDERERAVTEGFAGELKRLNEAKKRAVAAEDFQQAGALKKQILVLEGQQGTVEKDAAALAHFSSLAWAGALALARGRASSPAGRALVEALQAAAPAGTGMVAASAAVPPLAAAEAATAAAAAPGTAAAQAAAPAPAAAAAACTEETAPKEEDEAAERARKATGAKRWQELVGETSRRGPPEKKRCTQAAQTEQLPAEKTKEDQRPLPVKKEVVGQECVVPGMSNEQLLAKSNQELWQHAWNVTWQEADEAGVADDHSQLYADAQTTWKAWLIHRDRLVRSRAAEDGRAKAKEISAIAAQTSPHSLTTSTLERRSGAGSAPGADAKVEADDEGAQVPAVLAPEAPALSAELREAQERQWRASSGAQADWKRATAEADRRLKTASEAPKAGRELCALVKQRCPADQPLQFERLLAVCPRGTSVRQLIQAMSKEPQEFRQSWTGGEFCVRPANSRCVDWLPVQAATTPPDFDENATLPEEMLVAAKAIFEERLRPQGRAAEDPLAQFLTAPGRLPSDTPMSFVELLSRCPPGTEPTDLIRMMSKRRDAFRQNSAGTQFCVKPRTACRDWGPVNPYLDAKVLMGSG